MARKPQRAIRIEGPRPLDKSSGRAYIYRATAPRRRSALLSLFAALIIAVAPAQAQTLAAADAASGMWPTSTVGTFQTNSIAGGNGPTVAATFIISMPMTFAAPTPINVTI